METAKIKNIVEDLVKNVENDYFLSQTTNKLKEENDHLRNKIDILQNLLNNVKKQKIEMEVRHELRMKANESQIKQPVKLIIEENNSTLEVHTNQNVTITPKIPEYVFIVPYRDREPQRVAFMAVMKKIVEDLNCMIYFSHQRDSRPFNRGAIKNLGFLFVKRKYPNDYKNITFIFHDIDVMPWYKGQFSYQAQLGTINHFYGFKRALGGAFAIKGQDFEDVNGFPNYWSWGLEDNILRWRLMQKNKKIIYPQFVSSEKDNKNIIGLWHGWERLINNNLEYKARYKMREMKDGLSSLYNIRFEEDNMNDIFYEINIRGFETGETMKSPYVRNIVKQDARLSVKLNQYRRNKNRRRYKVGTAGSFGKKRGFGGMVMF